MSLQINDEVEIEEEQYMHECLLIIHYIIINLISGRLFIFLVKFTDVAAPSSDIRTCDCKPSTEDLKL